MSLTENESEDDMLSMDQVESPPTDDGHSEGNVNETVLKKGPWTSAEDAILVDYVKKHGEGNWNAVQKHSGLFRCGKSCRLRWANHLRPNLKKGSFTAEEERLIIELHAKMGNKWARMAAHLPGRTDNEIKNYWNTRIKRRQRAGLPLYPPEVRFQTLHDSQSQNSTGMNIMNEQNENSSFEIPDFICDRLKASQGILSYLPDIPSISAGSMLLKRTASCSSRYSSIPTMQQRKRIRQSMTPLYDFSASNRKRLPMIDPLQDFNQMAESFGLCIPFKPPDCYKSPLSFGAVQDNISISNGNHSASKPMFEAVKTELPSLQYPDTSFGSWEVPSPTPPLLEAAEELIQSPKQNGIVESRWPSPRNSGLLDALVYEAKALSNSRNNPNDKSSNSSRGTPFDLADCSALNLHETEWEDFVEPMSSYCSSTSVFSGSTPTSGDGILLDGHPITDAFPGCNVKLEPVDSIRMQDNEKEFPTAVDFPNPLFNSNWMEDKVFSEEQAVTNDPIAAFLHDDLMNDLKHNSSASCQGWGIGFYA